MFIMGVSATWLNLLNLYVDSSKGEGGQIEGTIEEFQRVDALASSTWSHEGRHAFLHHLGAVFGYEPLTSPGS